MEARNHGDLAAIIQRYGQIADAANRREMKRFIEELRQRWEPYPAEEAFPPRGEGYTDEGAFALCVFQLAFQDPEPEQQGKLCEAEERNQVLLHHPADGFVIDVPKPLTEPASHHEVKAKLASLRAQLQKQLGQSAVASSENIRLPDDFRELMSVTNGIWGAGVPSETEYTTLVHRLDLQEATSEMLRQISSWVKRQGFTALAAWEIGLVNNIAKFFTCSATR